MKSHAEKIKQFWQLMRFHKPIGIFLLLWPTLWALWLASDGQPQWDIVGIFIIGVIVMRAAGCVINDIADRKIDPFVERTQHRPLANGSLTVEEAWVVFVVLLGIALSLALYLNQFTILLAFVGVLLAIIYPFLKRITPLPQLGLGMAFAWSVPMAFAAETNSIPATAWVVFFAALIWPVMYDTLYAMVDYEDDRKIGVKSTAILFGKKFNQIIIMLQLCFLLLLIACGIVFHLSWIYFFSLLGVVFLFWQQKKLIERNNRDAYFAAFLQNNWVGCMVFFGIAVSYLW